MEEQLNKTNRLAQLPESNDREITITSTRGEAGKVLSMDQYATRSSAKEPQQFFTLSEAVEYFGRDAQVKRAFQEINEESSTRQKENQSIRKAS